MSYSTLFTSGLSLASLPRTEPEAQAASRPPVLQINVHPGTPRPRLRKRRSSLTLATSPIGVVKTPMWTTSDALRVVLRSPRDTTFLEALQNGTKSKTTSRRKNANLQPPLPAPTKPLPTLPGHIDASFSTSFATDDSYPSSPITSESTFASRPTHPPSHSRKSSSILPPVGRLRTSSSSGRGPLSSSPYAANRPVGDLDVKMVEDKGTVWYDDDDEVRKENGLEA